MAGFLCAVGFFSSSHCRDDFFMVRIHGPPFLVIPYVCSQRVQRREKVALKNKENEICMTSFENFHLVHN